MTPGASHGNDPRVQLEQPGGLAYLVLFALAVLLPTGLGVVLPRLTGDIPSSPSTLGTVLAITLVVYAAIVMLMRRHRLAMDVGGIDVATSFYTCKLRWEQVRLGAARVIDIDERTELRPMLKTNGASMPGFHSGWFRSRGFTRLFVATVGGKRLLWLPTHEGYDLLLQPRNPAATLERMKALAAGPAVAPRQRGR